MEVVTGGGIGVSAVWQLNWRGWRGLAGPCQDASKAQYYAAGAGGDACLELRAREQRAAALVALGRPGEAIEELEVKANTGVVRAPGYPPRCTR